MAVAHVGWLSGVGGGEVFLVHLVRALHALGLEQEVLALGPPGPACDWLAAAGVRVHGLPRRVHGGPLMLLRLTARLRRLRPDLVQTHGEGGALWGILAARLAGIRRVAALVYQSAPVRRDKMLAMRALLRRADAVIAGSQAIRTHVVTDLAVPPGKVRLIPCGIDTTPFAAIAAPVRDLTAGRPVLVSVGRLVARKGHATLLAALRLLLDRHGLRCDLLLAGDGPQRSALASLAAELGIQDRVRFLGIVHPTPPLLAQADLFVFPSLAEPQGLAVLEAMAAGVPVVASRVGGIPDMIDDGASGVLVPPGDPEALAGAVAGLIDDRAARAALAAGGRRRAAELDVGRLAVRFAELYRNLSAPSVERPPRLS